MLRCKAEFKERGPGGGTVDSTMLINAYEKAHSNAASPCAFRNSGNMLIQIRHLHPQADHFWHEAPTVGPSTASSRLLAVPKRHVTGSAEKCHEDSPPELRH
jgi:hypothetical protein